MRHTIIKLSMVVSILLFTQKPLAADESVPLLPQVIDGLNDRYAQKRCRSLERLLAQSKSMNEAAKLVCVNDFFNRIPYQSDIAAWGTKDYWAAPLETLIKGRADCEDYAIAKFYTLLRMGVPQEKLYLTYVKLPKTGEAHFILTYYASEDAVPLVLDNRNLKIYPALFGESFEPVYRFNLTAFVAYHEGKEQRLPMEGMKFRKWQDLKQRMRML